ncbi:MAG TPA: UDP-glucose/GDP-mannose dehydrogenase family protein [Acidimicrobiia bacterium]|jgi:UDPglucose 6-dehydrogenase
MSRVGVVGAGYVGLTTAACLAHLGHDVACGDVDVAKLAGLSKGDVPILEEGLPELVAEGLRTGRLTFVLGASSAAHEAEFIVLCVPTPPGDDRDGRGGAADLSYVRAALVEIAPVLRPGSVVVAKSTMPPGSARILRRWLESAGRSARDVGVASNPEFFREGSAVYDFLHPDRIVIGCDEADVAVRVSALYKGVQAPVLVTDCASAEMIKYASNCFLATKVSFINAIAVLCESVDADVREVTLGMGYDPRIGFDYLRPGPGFGGSCLPKDTAALIRVADEVGYDFALLRGVVDVNREQRDRVVHKIARAAGGREGHLDGVRVAVWGLTFKAGTDDLRESPALDVVTGLLEAGAVVAAYDPVAGDRARSLLVRDREVVLTDQRVEVALGGSAVSPTEPAAAPAAFPSLPLERLVTASDPYEACRGAEVLAVLTEWDEFRFCDLDRVSDLMATARVVDVRNLLDPAALRRRGFHYEGMGR